MKLCHRRWYLYPITYVLYYAAINSVNAQHLKYPWAVRNTDIRRESTPVAYILIVPAENRLFKIKFTSIFHHPSPLKTPEICL